MPTLLELLECEGSALLGIVNGVSYHAIDIVVQVASNGQTEPFCVATEWDRSWPAQLLEARKEIDDLKMAMQIKAEATNSLYRDYTAAQERAKHATWLESEVSRLTAELAPYKEAEAARRMGQTAQDAFQGMNDAVQDGQIDVVQDGVRRSYWRSDTGVVDPSLAPIFKKLCQCDDCLELRRLSGYPIAEIEGH